MINYFTITDNSTRILYTLTTLPKKRGFIPPETILMVLINLLMRDKYRELE